MTFFQYWKDHSISEYEKHIKSIEWTNNGWKNLCKSHDYWIKNGLEQKFEKGYIWIDITNEIHKKPHIKSNFEFYLSSEHYIIQSLGEIKINKEENLDCEIVSQYWNILLNTIWKFQGVSGTCARE